MRKNPQLPHVSCKYGAPMGRGAWTDDTAKPCRVFRVRMVDGDYDEGGAYWGGGGTPVYACISEGVQMFTRAPSREQAKAHFRAQANIKFIN